MMKRLAKLMQLLLTILLVLQLCACKSDGKVTGTQDKKTLATVTKTTIKAKTTPKSTSAAKSTTISEDSTNENDQIDIEDEVKDIEEDSGDSYSDSDNPWLACLKFDPYQVDLKGRTVKLSSQWDESWDPEIDNPHSRTEELFNCKIEFEQYVDPSGTSFIDKLILDTMAGIKFMNADIYRGYPSWLIPTIIRMGILDPVDDYIDFSRGIFANTASYNEYIDGKHYGMSIDMPRLFYTHYNVDIFEYEGIDDPFELAKAGQWNWDKFLDYAITLTQDKNGDGIIDQYALEFQTRTQLERALLISNGSGTISLRNGRYEADIFSKNALRALNFFRDITYVYKVIEPKAGLGGVGKGKAAMLVNYEWGNGLNVQKGLRMKTAPYPIGPDIDEYHNVGEITIAYFILNTNKDFTPKELVAIASYMQYRDPEDPNYIDPYTDFQNGNWKAYAFGPLSGLSEEDRKWWYDFHFSRPIHLECADSFIEAKNIIDKLYVDIWNGAFPTTVIDAHRLQIESAIADALK